MKFHKFTLHGAVTFMIYHEKSIYNSLVFLRIFIKI